MNTFAKKSKMLILMLLVVVAMLAMPITAMAAPEDNITVEFRYTPGNEYTIPQTYIFAGRTFVLLSQAAPVLESTLPVTRTYFYRITGDLTEADMLLVDDRAKVNFTPKTVIRDREIERFERITMLQNNDVDELGHGVYKQGTGSFKDFPIDPLKDPGVVKRPPMKVSSVQYDVDQWEDLNGNVTTAHSNGAIPLTYSADVVYKGLEDYEATEYWTGEATYSTVKPEGEVDQYVIIAVYEPTDLVDVTPAPAGTTPAPPVAPVAEIPETPTPLADAQQDNSIPENIVDGNVPLSSGLSTENTWSLLSLVLSVVAVCIGVFGVMQIYLNRRTTAEIADGKESSGIALNIVTGVIGIATLLMWLIMDTVSLNSAYVWINEFTPIVGLMLAATILVFVISSVRNRSNERMVDEATA